jgi:hypothetical protein
MKPWQTPWNNYVPKPSPIAISISKRKRGGNLKK